MVPRIVPFESRGLAEVPHRRQLRPKVVHEGGVGVTFPRGFVPLRSLKLTMIATICRDLGEHQLS